MALTGSPLLVLSVLATLGTVTLTVLCWRRGGRLRVLTRTTCILLCEALALFSGGLAVNDAFDDLYPSWSTLFQPDTEPSPATIAVGPDASLDVWLKGHVADARSKGLVFDWKPRELPGWQLPAAPTVYVPPAYFTDAQLRFPVVVLVAPSKAGPSQSGWNPATVAALVSATSADPVPAILVFLRADRADTARLLEQDLPDRLDTDVRVNGRGWAVVGVGTDAGLALGALAGAPQRYRSAVVVAGSDDVVGAPLVAQAHQSRVDQAVLVIVGGSVGGQGGGGQITDGPASGPPTNGPTAAGPSTGAVSTVSVQPPEKRLGVALLWAYQQLSPPLAAPVGGPPRPLPAITGNR